MPIPRIRFKVRHVMLAVLLVAAVLGAFEAGRRWERRPRPRSNVVATPMGLMRLPSPAPLANRPPR